MNKIGNAVLLIDDEPQIRRFLRTGFEFAGFSVREAANAAEGLKSATLTPPDLIILDLGLPDLPGSEVLERIRSWSNVPIIILSIEAREEEKVRLLKAGADDYVVKPFGISELLARGDTVLRRYFEGSAKDAVVKAGALSVDLALKVVTRHGKRVRLTRKEYKLLQILSINLGLVVTHQQLLTEIWHETPTQNVQYLRILVRKLRAKIEDDPNDPRILINESGVGYRLESSSEDRAARTAMFEAKSRTSA
ncbi:MAG: response regulator [Xanthobacteraceae bacterium]|jgi:two-component system KDP operon response regulator KdpE